MQTILGGSKKPPNETLLQYCYDNRVLILQNILSDFVSDTSLTPEIGLELEFYLLQQDGSQIDDLKMLDGFIDKLSQHIKDFPHIYAIEKEQGLGQIEIKLAHSSDLLQICDEVISVKDFIHRLAKQKGLRASFQSQPFDDDCGSALQCNLSFGNADLFDKVAVSLLYYTKAMMVFLAPKSEDYVRFDKSTNVALFKKGKYSAPVNVSLGMDNRSCAVRVKPERLEYRVAAADADPYLVMSVLLLAIVEGFKNGISGDEKVVIHGNAFDEQYEVEELPQSYEEALACFAGSEFFKLGDKGMKVWNGLQVRSS